MFHQIVAVSVTVAVAVVVIINEFEFEFRLPIVFKLLFGTKSFKMSPEFDSLTHLSDFLHHLAGPRNMAASKPISLSTNIEIFLFSLNNNFWFVLITIQKSFSLLYPLIKTLKYKRTTLSGLNPIIHYII